jgi:hypothetical protein
MLERELTTEAQRHREDRRENWRNVEAWLKAES